jgi:hypothetical protein
MSDEVDNESFDVPPAGFVTPEMVTVSESPAWIVFGVVMVNQVPSPLAVQLDTPPLPDECVESVIEHPTLQFKTVPAGAEIVMAP